MESRQYIKGKITCMILNGPKEINYIYMCMTIYNHIYIYRNLWYAPILITERSLKTALHLSEESLDKFSCTFFHICDPLWEQIDIYPAHHIINFCFRCQLSSSLVLTLVHSFYKAHKLFFIAREAHYQSFLSSSSVFGDI